MEPTSKNVKRAWMISDLSGDCAVDALFNVPASNNRDIWSRHFRTDNSEQVESWQDSASESQRKRAVS